jgi:L-aminopeptidase/D-esterase-like protein
VITDVAGIRVGHWTHPEAQTGCTVILFPEGTVASGEVRGGAPATREFDLLSPERIVDRLDAVVLTGGSAFGLAAADGVMRWCAEEDSGFPTGAGPVPIVVAMALFDLLVGDGSVRPGAVEGYAACSDAGTGHVQVGRIGAGAGATIGKWRGREHARPGGLGSATVRDGELVVSALIALNAVGDIDDGSEPSWPPPPPEGVFGAAGSVFGAAGSVFGAAGSVFGAGENTTIGVVATNAKLDKVGCLLVAQGGHDGLARALMPSHARGDGDAIVAAATGGVDAVVDHVRFLAVRAAERAIRSVAPAGHP